MFPAIQFFIVLLALSCATDALYRVQLTRRKRILNAESKRKPSPSRSFRYSPNIFTYPPMLAEKQYDLPLNNHENVFYTAKITIGVPPQEFEVAIDTGSDVLWVNCAGCLAEECQERGAFDCSKSATCVLMEEKPKPIHYVQGNAWGPIDKDFVCIGDASSGFCGRIRQNLTCSLQRNELDILQDGIFGLSAEGESPELESAMGRLLRYSGCEDKKVAIWLNRDSEAENGGEMTICGVDKNHYQGDLVWIPLEHGPNWYVRMDDVLIGSHRISLGQTEAVIDSGWTIMAAPYEEYPKIANILNASIIPYGRNGILSCRCSSVDELPTLTFVLNGNPFSIPPEAYAVKELFSDRCEIFINQYEIWVLGDVFLGQYYSVFDFKNKRVGLAKATT